jgi:putative lipoic acid-binding regulatory protein
MKDKSNSTYEEKKVFKDVLTFPTNFTIKIVGQNHPTFVNDIIASVAAAIGILPDTIKYSISNSKQGNYISVTVTPYFQNSDEIYAAYDAISKDKRVKYVI